MISCDCSCDDYDPPAVYRDRIVKARKTHYCCECSDEIHPGKRYEYIFGVWDGRSESYHTCLTCVAIRKHYCPSGWLLGDLAQQICDCLGFDYRYLPDADEAEEIDREDAARVERERTRGAAQ